MLAVAFTASQACTKPQQVKTERRQAIYEITQPACGAVPAKLILRNVVLLPLSRTEIMSRTQEHNSELGHNAGHTCMKRQLQHAIVCALERLFALPDSCMQSLTTTHLRGRSHTLQGTFRVIVMSFWSLLQGTEVFRVMQCLDSRLLLHGWLLLSLCPSEVCLATISCYNQKKQYHTGFRWISSAS